MSEIEKWEVVRPEDVRTGDELHCTLEWSQTAYVNEDDFRYVSPPFWKMQLRDRGHMVGLTLRRKPAPKPVTLGDIRDAARLWGFSGGAPSLASERWSDFVDLLARYDSERARG